MDQVRAFARVIWLDKGWVRADGPGREVCTAYEADVAARRTPLGRVYFDHRTWLHGGLHQSSFWR